MNQRYVGWAALLTTTFAWATSHVFAKIAFTEITPLIFVSLRYTLACPLLLLILWKTQQKQNIIHSIQTHRKYILGSALSGIVLSQGLKYIALNIITASETILVESFTTVFSVLLAAIFLGEIITRRKAIGIITAIAGVALIILGGSAAIPDTTLVFILGDVIILVSGLFWGINAVLSKITLQDVDPVTFTFAMFSFSIPFLWFVTILFEDITILFQISAITWFLILWISLVNSVVGFVLWYWALHRIEAIKAQTSLGLVTVWGLLLSYSILNELVFPMQILGGACTVFGVWVTQESEESPNMVKE